MPENEINETQDVQAHKVATPAETRREKFERERLSRRAALKKMGITSGMALFAMFSVDDLAHMVGKALKQRAGDNQVAELVARELRQAGVAMAAAQSGTPTCQHCDDETHNESCYCVFTYGPYGTNPSPDKLSRCESLVTDNKNKCKSNCTGSSSGASGDCTTFTQPPGWSG